MRDGLLSRFFSQPDVLRTAAEKADRVGTKLAEKRARLAAVRDDLRAREAEGALAEALDEPGALEQRRQRAMMREEEADLTGAVEALEAALEELAPAVVEEEARAALAEYKRAFEAARAVLLDRARPALRSAVEAWAVVEASYEEAVVAAQEFRRLRRQLEEDRRNGLPVPPSSVDKKLIAGLRRWEALATNRELPDLLTRAREEE